MVATHCLDRGWGAHGRQGPAANALASRWLDWWGFPLSMVELGGSVIFIVGLVGMTVCDAAIRWARR